VLLGNLYVGHGGSCFLEFGCSVLEHSECYEPDFIQKELKVKRIDNSR
jgi:hypothetical protein